MKNNFILDKLIQKIETGEDLSPVLFDSSNLEIANREVLFLIEQLFSYFSVPKQALFILKDNWENIKIEEIKDFMQNSFKVANFDFQIFFIENISRFTDKSANACLKFFEEPGKKNIIFLTNSGENQVLETILSRVSKIKLDTQKVENKNMFFSNLIEDRNKNTNLYSYFFSSKLEKQEYIDFLDTLFIYGKTHFSSSFLLELDEDIFAVKKNNVLVKYIVDKWILKISN